MGKSKVVSMNRRTPADPLDVPLLNAGFPLEDVRCLPFVRDLKPEEREAHMKRFGSGRMFWNVPPSVDYNHDCEVGQRFGAAYLAHLSAARGWGLNLIWILEQMAGDEARGFKVGFLQQVQLYARSMAVLATRDQIESRYRDDVTLGRTIVRERRSSRSSKRA